MMSKFQRSWALAKICLGVLGRNKKLLVFPVVTFCFWVVMIVMFFTPLTLVHTGYSFWQAAHWQSLGQGFVNTNGNNTAVNGALFNASERWLFWFSIYFGAMLVGTFANVAFYHEILAALRGGPVSIRHGLRFAMSRWKSVLFWSLFAGLIGLVIRMIEEKVGFFGRIVTAFLGAAWSVASIFVIPVLVESESPNPVASLKRSASILLRTWGEAVIGFVGVRVGGVIMTLITILTVASSVTAGVLLQNFWIPLMILPAWFAVLFTYSYVMSVASHIYRGALYLYASEGQVADGFSSDMMNSCWKRKKA